MEVHLRPEVQAKLERMARESGRPGDELLEDAILGYFDELEYAREMLDRRYDAGIRPPPGSLCRP